MNKKRLLKLAALLDVVPPEKFYMGHWATAELAIGDEPVCCTAACALGWATTIPEFKRAGLELVAHPGKRHAHIRLGERINSDAAAELFGLRWSEALQLFEEGFSRGPREVAHDIRVLVARG